MVLSNEPGIPAGFSRESKIRIDRDGHFWHEGERIEHKGLAQGFARWIARDDSGRWILRNDLDWCFITVDDAPLVANSATVNHDDSTVVLHLSDGTEGPLRLDTLLLRGEDRLYCTVHSAGILTRFSRAAAFAVLDNVSLTDGHLTLRVGAIDHPLAVQPDLK